MDTLLKLSKNIWVRVGLAALVIVGMGVGGFQLALSITYHPPFIPITFSIDSDGHVSMNAASSIATPAGDFDISADPANHLQIPDNGILMTIQHLLNGKTKVATFQVHEDESVKIINVDDGDLIFRIKGQVIDVDARGHHKILLTSPNASGGSDTSSMEPTPTGASIPPTSTEIPPTPTPASTPAQKVVYEATVPGCMPADNLWTLRGSSTITCTGKGMEMSASGIIFNEAAFDPRQLDGVGDLTTYCVKTTAEFLADSAGAAIIIGVHGQDPGGQVIQFFQDGELAILRFPHNDGTTTAPDTGPSLGKATFSASSPYHLAVGVDGSHITVWVNQTQVATAVDSTYTTTGYVLIGLKADTSMSQEQTDKASFSDFVFQAGSLANCGS